MNFFVCIGILQHRIFLFRSSILGDRLVIYEFIKICNSFFSLLN